MVNRGINKVILIGNLGQDPEIRYMPNGSTVANINLATSDNWKDKQSGEIKEKTEWHRVVLYGKLAEIANEYLRKGSQVYIEGSLKTRKWQDKNGNDRYSTEVVVNVTGTMQMLGNRQNNNPTLLTTEKKNKLKNNKFIEKNNFSSSNRRESLDVNFDENFDDDDITF